MNPRMSELDLRHTTALLFRKADNIEVVIADLSAHVLYTPTSNVPAKHKVARCDFPVRDPARAYGYLVVKNTLTFVLAS